MNLNRRKYLALSAGTALGVCAIESSAASDGVGPNRGVVARTLRGKQTCNNVEVPLSEVTTRLSLPQDFTGDRCQLIEDSFEGPYFTCVQSQGKAIAKGQAGQPLTVAFRLVDSNCQPIPGGVVDIWACNATGHCSGYDSDPDKRPPLARIALFGHLKPNLEARFCRGALRTDDQGIAEFDTVYPGFYYGQPIHIHMKAHVDGTNLLTSQVNLPESMNDKIMRTKPYADPRPISRSTRSMGFPVMNVLERGDRLLATMDLVVPE